MDVTATPPTPEAGPDTDSGPAAGVGSAKDPRSATAPDPATAGLAPIPRTTPAWTQERYGIDALALDEIEIPRPGPGQLLVRVAATSINAADKYTVTCPALAMRPMFGLRGPRQRIPGLDIAGTVVAVGEPESESDGDGRGDGDGAGGPADQAAVGIGVGDHVFGEAHGAWAGYAIAERRHVAIAPEAIPLADAAALPVAGLTALQGLRDHGGVTDGARVLVYGATGSVGTLAVQIAAALGARVTAVCSSDAADMVTSLGAHEIVERTEGRAGDTAAHLVADGRRFDVVFDVAGVASTRARGRLLADGGTCVLVGAPSGGSVLGPISSLVGTIVAGWFVRGRFRSFVASANAADLATLAELVDAGTLRPMIEHRFEFEQLPVALERFVTRSKRGKLLVVGPVGD